MMRLISDFPTNGRSFYLVRAVLDPPSSLCKMLFPAIDKWHGRPAVKKLSPDNNNPIQPMIPKTFIQDSVLMMELHPSYPIWQHSIFFDPTYLSFKRDLLQIEAQEHDPAITMCASAL
ncbi:hypothetical protein [Absidia glauca]|uniref:Ndc10 domain-containing protein n=1 Tax=Absidia glauca TaxID=4829 RepID=A0A163JZK0_ABSGL|nr:hypothetical protein [Absidia glauca]